MNIIKKIRDKFRKNNNFVKKESVSDKSETRVIIVSGGGGCNPPMCGTGGNGCDVEWKGGSGGNASNQNPPSDLIALNDYTAKCLNRIRHAANKSYKTTRINLPKEFDNETDINHIIKTIKTFSAYKFRIKIRRISNTVFLHIIFKFDDNGEYTRNII